MKTYTVTELAEIIEKHGMWLRGEGSGSRADLYNADLYNADLYNADLRNADLRNANLRNADLRNADLYNANLRNASLYNANLYNANLYNADLRNADLRNADLRNALICGVAGEMTHLKSIFLEEYQITYTAEVIQIGCQRHKIEDWWKFDDEEIIEMDGKRAIKFWRKYKDFIKMAIELSPAKPTKEAR